MNEIGEAMVEKIQNEYSQVEKGSGWPNFFMAIRAESNALLHETTEAKKLQNKKFNRYQDVNPYDHSRVILTNGPTDYINASIVSVEKADRKYILAQGPLPHTTPHFWLMVWQEESQAIIMLNRVIEKNQIKCHQYWPLSNEDSYVFNEVGLKVSQVSEEKASYYTVAKLKLENLESQTSREVYHFHYTTWPDFGCPQSPTAFLRFLALVRSSGALDARDKPAVVHCSAGIGRSGTFCLVDSCLRLIKEKKEDVVVRNVLLEMRNFRMGLVQTPDQLRFSYLAIIEGLSTDINVNGSLEVDEEGEEETEEPPPLPPPRSESLGARQTASRNDDEVRRRNVRNEKQEKLANTIKDVKENMKNSEKWEGTKTRFLRPAGIAAILFTGSCIIYWMYRG